ncbi:UNVERIFIED_CONTAM: hypothetical protein PYX00_004992 [Menopon gallinae]|uniref:Elongation of very long chain fatty acids protein n=1 Tax=Menopon gallinae TaxID=328185 RepID=A0AAW2I6W4_9NEOP
MALLLKTMYHLYQKAVIESSDPRTRNWFMTGSPIPCIILLLCYNYFVQKLGPELMKDRKPFNVDRLIQIYNIIQVLLCSWLVIECFMECYGPTGSYSWTCEPIDYSESPKALKVAKFVWIYFMLKISDLLDTIFFVLRKKNSQITFLHIYHHTGMVMLGWGGTTYLPGGHGVFLGFINSFVHCVMYSYYFLTNYNPELKKNLWWKKYITQLQMIQFLMIIIHFGFVLVNPYCTYPRWVVLVFIPQNVFMFILFWDFYKKAYLRPKKTPVADAKEISSKAS